VHLRHAFPGGQSEYERVLGCPVHFGAEANELWLPRGVVLHPSPSHSAETIRHLEEVAEKERQRLGEPSFAVKLHRMLVQRLPREAIDADALAATLHLGVRTLRRRLADEGTRYSDVLDGARRELALELLAAGEPVGRVAARCGFANTRNFARAFRRWTGATPAAFRASSPT
jgi:AraC-like DNA-binding protein